MYVLHFAYCWHSALNNDENLVYMSTVGLANEGGDIMSHRRGLARCQCSGFIHILPGCARSHSKSEGMNTVFSIFVAFGKHCKVTLGSR